MVTDNKDDVFTDRLNRAEAFLAERYEDPIRLFNGIEGLFYKQDKLQSQLELAAKALRQVLNRAKVHDHEGYEEIAQQALRDLGVK